MILQIYLRTLQEHITSLIVSHGHTLGFPYATAPFTHPDGKISPVIGLVGFRFLVQLVNEFCELLSVRPAHVFVVFGCLWGDARWRTHRYSVCTIWPSYAITRQDSSRIFAHILRHFLVGDLHFYSLGPLGWTVFRMYVKADIVWSTAVCGLHMGSQKLLLSDDESIFCTRKKKSYKHIPIRHVTAFHCFSYTPPQQGACISRTTMGLGAYEGFHLTNSHMGIPNLAFEVQKVIFGYFISISVACPILKAKELV